MVQSDALTFDGETLAIRSYRDEQTDSGNVAVRYFCSDCGTPIRTVVEGAEETSYLKSGESRLQGFRRPLADPLGARSQASSLPTSSPPLLWRSSLATASPSRSLLMEPR